MLRPEYLKQIDDFIDNLNVVKLYARFVNSEEDDPKIAVAKDAIKEYDAIYGDPDDGCFTDMSDYH